MPYDPAEHSGRLKRLPAERYRGLSFVFWTLSVEGRRKGWLDEIHHLEVRELLCHVLSRFRLICPSYSLMPDHSHFLWIGTADDCDQVQAMRFFRVGWDRILREKGHTLQRQSFDRVLRKSDREKNAPQAVCHYIFMNPEKEGFGPWTAYPYLGAMIPGYPNFHPKDEDYWDRFWRVFNKVVTQNANAGGTVRERLTASATSRSFPD